MMYLLKLALSPTGFVTSFWREVKSFWTLVIWIHALHNVNGRGFIYIYRWVVELIWTIGYPCGMRVSKYWCVSQHFAKLLWYWYSLWTSHLLNGLCNCISPGWSARLWYLASCWRPVDCGHTTWVKINIPQLGGISLMSHTCSSSFRILLKVSATYLWDIPYLSIGSHTWCVSLCEMTYHPLSGMGVIRTDTRLKAITN